MAMKPDLPLAADTWHDFYAVTGFAPGTDVVFCNRGYTRLMAFEGDQPANDSIQGGAIQGGEWCRIRADSAWVWSASAILLGGLQEFQG